MGKLNRGGGIAVEGQSPAAGVSWRGDGGSRLCQMCNLYHAIMH